MITTLPGSEFRDGDSVVLAEGTYQGTPGMLLRLKDDPNRYHRAQWEYSKPSGGMARTQRGGPQMNACIATDIGAWEDEGGAAPALAGMRAVSMSGTVSEVEWAERIKLRVNAEFDRVAAAFRSVAGKQGDDKRTDTEIIIAILESKRAEVMSRDEAGYFIHDWQEISDQVRQMIFSDIRYQAIKSARR